MKNGLLTNSERARRGLTADSTCPCCGLAEETSDHLFRHCPMAKDCWIIANSPPEFHYSNHLPLSSWLHAFCSGRRSNQGGDHWRILFPHIHWNLWKGRNSLVFNGVIWNTTQILGKATHEASEAQALLLKKNGPIPAKQLCVKWIPPPQGTVKVNTDGAHIGDVG